ncbi:Acg family FMN-binding oxidoreductase [Nocardia huaxiensis]|uniref:NAD(P)H nitroreductase n=1 Tax=Nocardia huaxiensis TaxID=2755382 RepID=A0A7D6V7Z0_9NOCA|nr:hypothetical protein [Nocardia huaxiensis]QLY28591.1 hypothetical protein H0264_25015 [Nocardia huaxiensis]UFS97938.1 hypothetical protein LPY97_08580 [Nocardia huaxiensis]
MPDLDTRAAATVPDDATLLEAMRIAARAPSVHNTQPWRWVFDGSRLHLHGDLDRRLLATDPHCRQWVISCGAALHHARTAFAAHGWHTDVVRLPDRERPDLLASVRFYRRPEVPGAVAGRAAAIERRYTDRLPLSEPTGWADLLPVLRALAEPHDLVLDVYSDNDRARLVAASRQAVGARRYDPLYEAELDWWTGHPDPAQGIPPDALSSAAERERVELARRFPEQRGADRRAALRDRAAVVVLSTHDDTEPLWLHTGEALSAVLLECTARGLATCALTHVTELPAARRAVAAPLGRHVLPQVLIRIGTAPAGELPTRTPRRPLSEIFTNQPATPADS